MEQLDLLDKEGRENHRKEMLEAINKCFASENTLARCVVLVWDIETMRLKTWSANATLYDASFMLRTGCEITESKIMEEESPEALVNKEIH